ncbi:hypothetical protein MKW94_023503 [Papaver nudicaule]|uniref:Pentatricopeptide repeat-containing protein n=1 Tax=Papaver nudicaule TaxID=74823 RepID=A0AA41RUP5_PAPNU|nr:hypothetical protein [Papaver nudicaule]
MISSYVQNNCFKEGLAMFRLMQLTDLEPDEGIFVSLLSGCAHLGSVDIGIWIHRYLMRKQLPMTVQLHTALIDMYAKCGNLDLAKNLFDGMQEKDVICWNVMISGFTIHGDVENALALFEEMEKHGFRPNDITFIAHYGCVINLLSRAGLFEEAKEIILRMPASCSPSDEAINWRALLSACCSHGETSLAEVATERLVQLERHSGVYVLLSNMYAGSGKYDDAKRIRKNMKERGVEKTPGCSSIEVNGFIHEFVAGEKTHPQLEEIHNVMEKMTDQLEYRPQIN